MSQIPTIPVVEAFVGPEYKSAPNAQQIASTLLQDPSFSKASEAERSQFFDTITETLAEKGEVNRGQLKNIRDFSSQLKFHMGQQKGDLPVEEMWDTSIDDMGMPEYTALTKEVFSAKPIEEQFRLYRTQADTQRNAALGQRLMDIAVAAKPGSGTYTHIAGVIKDGLTAFITNLPDYDKRGAITRGMQEMKQAGTLTPEREAELKAEIEKIDIETTILEREVAGDAFSEWDAYKKANPYGVDFVKNRAIDVAIGIPFGVMGATVRAGAGATALEIGRAVTAPVVSSAAQGTAFDWGFEKIVEGISDESWFKNLSENEKTGMRVMALGASLLATIPIDMKVQRLLAGRTGAEVTAAIAKEVAGRPDILAAAAKVMEDSKTTGQEITALMSADPIIAEGLTEVAKRVGVAPADFHTAQIHALLEEATVTSQGLKSGNGVVPHQEKTVTELIETTPPSAEVPLTVTAQEIGVKEAAVRAQYTNDAAKDIIRLRQELETAQEAGAHGLVPAIESEIAQLESGILNAVTQAGKTDRLAEITTAMVKETDKEQWRILAAERAQLDPVWKHTAIEEMNIKQLELAEQLNSVGVQFERPLLANGRPSPYPADWKFPGLQSLSKEVKIKADNLIEELVHNAYDRVPIITTSDYRATAGAGRARPGRGRPRLPEEEVAEATRVAKAPQELPKELKLPKEGELVVPGSSEALAIEAMPKSPAEQILGDIIKNKWAQMIGEPLNPARILNAEKRASELMKQTFKAIETAPLTHSLPSGETIFSIAGLEAKFPALQGVLSRAFNMPTMVADAHRALLKDGYVTSDAIYQFMENVWGQVAIHDMPGWWARNRGTIEAADQMWELARVSVPAPKVGAIESFMSDIRVQKEVLGLSETNIAALKKTIEKVFPDFNLSARFDKAIKGAGQFEAVLRTIVLNPEKATARTLFHEIGHYYFSHILTSAERLQWLDTLRPAIENASIFAEAFPDIAARLVRADAVAPRLGSRGAQMVMYQLRPSELFAEVWIDSMLKGKIPKVGILDSQASMFKGAQGFSMLPKSHFDSLPEAMKQLLTRLNIGPSPEQLTKVRESTRIALRDANPFYRSAEEAQARIEEIVYELESKHGGPLAYEGGKLQEGVEYHDVTKAQLEGVYGKDVFDSFFDLPIPDQIELLARRNDVEGMLSFTEMHSLNLMHGDQTSRVAAEAMHKRLEYHFSDRAMAERATYSMERRREEFKLSGEDFEIDAYTGLEKDKTLSFESVEAIEKSELQRYKAQLATEKDFANRQVYLESLIRKEDGLPALTRLEKEDIRAQAKRDFYEGIEDRSFDELAKEIANGKIPNAKQNPQGWTREYYKAYKQLAGNMPINDSVTSSIRMDMASKAVEYDYLRQLHNHALAEQGLMDIAELPYFKRFDHAQQIAELAWDSSLKGTVLRHTLSRPIEKTIRYGSATFLGWDQDETGKWFFNPELMYTRMQNSPWLMLLHPGAKLGIQLAGRGAKAMGAKAFDQLSLETQKKATDLWEKFQYNFMEYRGTDPTIELMRRASLRTAGNIKQNALDATEAIMLKYNAEQRQIIGKIVDRTPEGLELMEKMIVDNPGLIVTADRIRNLYRANTNFLIEQGLLASTDRVFVNRVWNSVGKESKTMILSKNPTLKGVRMDHLKSQAPSFKTGDARAVGQTPDGVSLFFEPQVAEKMQFLASQGEVNLVQGLRLNSYYDAEKAMIFVAPIDSSLDKVYKESLKPYQIWDPVKESSGMVLDKITGVRGTPNITIKRNFTAAERELKGESFDVALKLTAFAERVEKAMAKADVFSRVATAGPDYAINVSAAKKFITVSDSTAPMGTATLRTEDAKAFLLKKGWKELPSEFDKATGLRKFGALSDHLVSPETYRMLRSFDSGEFMKNLRMQYPSIDFYSKNILQPFKMAKTVLNIPTHLVNFISNGFQGHLAGRNSLADLYHGYGMMQARKLENNVRKARISGNMEELLAAEKTYKEHPYTEALKDARIARIGDSSLIKSEIDFNALQRTLETVKDVNDMGKIEALLHLAQAKARRGADFMKHLYEGEDLVYKLGGFYGDLKAGKSVEESLQSIYQAYFDYGSLPAGVAAIRDTGLVPFISYTYKAIPGMIKGIYENPHRLAIVMLGAEAANLMMIASDYGMDNMITMQQSLDTLAPDYREKRIYGVRSSIYLGQTKEKDAYGSNREVSRYFNFGKYMPGGTVSESYNAAAVKQGKAIYQDIASAVFANPLINIAFTAAAGKDPTFGREVKGWEEQGKYIWQTMVPNWPVLPGTRGYDSMQQALVNLGIRPPSEDYTGFTGQGIAKTFASESLNAVAGLRTYRVDDEYEGVARLREVKTEMGKAQKEMRKAITAPGLPQSAHVDILKKYEEEIQKSIKYMERVSGAIGQRAMVKSREAVRVPGLPRP